MSSKYVIPVNQESSDDFIIESAKKVSSPSAIVLTTPARKINKGESRFGEIITSLAWRAGDLRKSAGLGVQFAASYKK